MKNRTQSKQNSGFTVVEVLATVAIVVILLAVSAISVVSYLDGLKIVELDNAARDIYMAAQNRAVLLSNAQRLNDLVDRAGTPTTLPGHSGSEQGGVSPLSAGGTETPEVEVYFVSGAKAGDDLLTNGSIDPTLLKGDFYIVYDLSSGSVTDVIYAEGERSLSKLLASAANEGEEFKKLYTTWWATDRSNRVKQDMLVGWYSGFAAQGGSYEPDISENTYIDVKIENGEELTVTVTVREDYIQDIWSGLSELEVLLGPAQGDGDSIDLWKEDYYDSEINSGFWSYTWMLDSLMKNKNGEYIHKFMDLVQEVDDDGYITGYKVTPGDDFQVVATLTMEDGEEISDRDVSNSLFEYREEDEEAGEPGSNADVAYIGYLRHLQNLDGSIGGPHEKTSAVQTAHIWGQGYPDREGQSYYTAYEGYVFVPISNSFTLYDGDGYEIRNLVVSGANSVGLFGESAPATMQNIRMVNTVVHGNSYAGALVGRTRSGITIDNCWVYWDEKYLPDGKTLEDVLEDCGGYAITGQYAGGLVGSVMSSTIKNSLAATLVKGTTVGGLVGLAPSLTITNSYADCYLTGSKQAAGLVGNVVSGISVTLESCYAAGFIVDTDTTGSASAGLFLGSGTTNATGVYSVMLCIDSDGNTHSPEKLFPGTSPGLNLVGGSIRDLYYLGAGGVIIQDQEDGSIITREMSSEEMADPTFIDYMSKYGFAKKARKDTHPYNLRKELGAYEYPGLESLPHYGDWGWMTVKPVSLVYYEDYGENMSPPMRWRLPGFSDSTATRGQTSERNWIRSDGYAVIFPQSELPENTNKVTVNYEYGNDSSSSKKGYVTVSWGSGMATYESTHNVIGVKKPYRDGLDSAKNQVLIPITANGKEYYMILLPDALVNEQDAPENFYEYLKLVVDVGDGETKLTSESFFNPHFARSVVPLGDNWSQGETITREQYVQTYLIGWINPIVRTARHLYNLSRYEVYLQYEFYQELDVNFDEYTGYGLFTDEDFQNTPIGSSYSNPFTGTYDGGGNTVYGLYINAPDKDYQGLFGMNDGTIRNLTVSGEVTGHREVGGIVGSNDGTVENCSNGAVVTGNQYVGGIVGMSYDGAMDNCSNAGTVTGSRLAVGGVVGSIWYDCTVENCQNAVSGTVTGETAVGGIVGMIDNVGTIEVLGCTNEGTVSVTDGADGTNVGGIVGDIAQVATLTDCNNTGTVTGNKNVGGIVGRNEGGMVTGCSNAVAAIDDGNGGSRDGMNDGMDDGSGDEPETVSGTVTGNKYVGGIVGYNGRGCTVELCENNGAVVSSYTISGDEDADIGAYAGGIVGWSAGPVSHCENNGTVTSKIDEEIAGEMTPGTKGMGSGSGSDPDTGAVTSTGTYTGGVVGYNSRSTVSDCVNNGEVAAPRGQYVGGVVGCNDNGTVSGSDNGADGKVNALFGSEVGGVVGRNTGDDAVVTDCANEGTVGTESTIRDTDMAEEMGEMGGGTGMLSAIPSSGSRGAETGTNPGTDPGTGTGTIIRAGVNFGGVVGFNDTTAVVIDCANKGTVSVSNGDDMAQEMLGSIFGSSMANSITTSGGQNIGGIAGQNTGTVERSANEGQVSVSSMGGGMLLSLDQGTVNSGGADTTDGMNIGGIVGYNAGGTVKDCTNEQEGTVGDRATDGTNVGGIVGYYESGTLAGLNTNSGAVSGKYNVGGVVGLNCDTVDGVNNAVSGTGTVTGSNNVGGFVGYNDTNATVTGCLSSGEVSPNTGSAFGGVVGYNIGAVTGCENYAWIGSRLRNGTTTDVGGIVGYNIGTVSECRNHVGVNSSRISTLAIAITGGSFENVGGVVGYNGMTADLLGLKFGVVTDCSNGGAVEVSRGSSVGGVVGYNAGELENITNTGAVTGKTDVGGLVGYNTGAGAKLEGTNTNSGDVTGSSNVGGLVGYNTGTGENLKGTNTNSGDVTGSDERVGGLVGYNVGSTLDGGSNISIGAVTGGSYVGGYVGRNDNGTVRNFVNRDLHITADGQYVGGIVGVSTGASAVVSDCENYGTVGSEDNGYVGGLVGGNGMVEVKGELKLGELTIESWLNWNWELGPYFEIHTTVLDGGTVRDCHNYGMVSGAQHYADVIFKGDYTANCCVGGIVGFNTGENSLVEDCTNQGQVEGFDSIHEYYLGNNPDNEFYCDEVQAQYVGGIVGANGFWSRYEAQWVAQTDDFYIEDWLFSEEDIEAVGGTIKNCRNTQEGSVTGGYNVGGLVGITYYGSLEGTSTNNGTVKNGDSYGSNIGGLVGWNYYGTVTGTNTNTGPIMCSALAGTVGGLVGLNDAGTVTGTNTNSGPVMASGVVGGLVGWNYYGVLDGINENSGEVTSKFYDESYGTVVGGSYVGGLVGRNMDGTVTGTNTNYSSGIITGDRYVGGIVGGGRLEGINTNYSDITTVRYQTGYSEYIGGIVGSGSAEGTKNTNYGDISGDSYVGGIAGDGSVTNGVNTGNITAYGGDYYNSGNYAGGITGSGSAENCVNTGDVTGSSNVGGIAGYGRTMINCHNTGAVTGTGTGATRPSTSSVGLNYYGVGGIVGVRSYSSPSDTVANCSNTGPVTGTDNDASKDYYGVGGIVGFSYSGGGVEICYNTGPVTGADTGASIYTMGVGGVVGVNFNASTVENCYSTGAVEKTSERGYVGGVVAYNIGSTVRSCYSYIKDGGSVIEVLSVGSTVNLSFNGTLQPQTVENCYFLGDSDSGYNVNYGKRLTEDQFKDQDSFTDWDFDEIWEMADELGRPILRSNDEREPFEIGTPGAGEEESAAAAAQAAIPETGEYEPAGAVVTGPVDADPQESKRKEPVDADPQEPGTEEPEDADPQEPETEEPEDQVLEEAEPRKPEDLDKRKPEPEEDPEDGPDAEEEPQS